MPIKALLAEAIGTFFVVFVMLAVWLLLPGTSDATWLKALAPGLAIIAATYAFGHVSGGHFNPTLTIGLVAGGRFDIAHAPGFLIAQTLGACLAALLIYTVLATGEPAIRTGIPDGRRRQQTSMPKTLLD